MKVVYVAGRFRASTPWGIEGNIRAAETIGLEVARLGASPIIPHANTRYFHGQLDDKFWLDATMELLERSDAVILVEGWRASEGSRGEVCTAIELGIPVFISLLGLKAWLEAQT